MYADDAKPEESSPSSLKKKKRNKRPKKSFPNSSPPPPPPPAPSLPSDGGRLKLASRGHSYRPEVLRASPDGAVHDGGDMQSLERAGFSLPAGYEWIDLDRYEEKVHHNFSRLKRGLPRLQHSLESVLLSPGIHYVSSSVRGSRKRRSSSNNLLGKIRPIPQPEELYWKNLAPFVSPFDDKRLARVAEKDGSSIAASSSSLTAPLSKFVLFCTNRTGPNLSWLSDAFTDMSASYTKRTLRPVASKLFRNEKGMMFLESQSYSNDTILTKLGHSVELLLSHTNEELSKRYLCESNPKRMRAYSTYQYTKLGGFTMRSQLDGYSPYLSAGSQVFDIKARAISAIRYHLKTYSEYTHQTLRSLTGIEHSYEREFYDLSRSALLKFYLQARIGDMGGMFMAYHNTRKLLGFEYLSRSEMANILLDGEALADKAYKISVAMLEKTITRVADKFPNDESIALMVDHNSSERLNVYAYPIPKDDARADETVHAIWQDPANERFRGLHLAVEIERYAHPMGKLQKDQRLSSRYAPSLSVAMKITEKKINGSALKNVVKTAWFN